MAEQLTIGQSIDELRRLASCLEDPKLGLEDAMAVHEKAKHLEAELRERLSKAEMRVEIISTNGKIIPFVDEREDGSGRQK